MIFAIILLLQLVQYNVEGKHFLVETKDDNSMEVGVMIKVMDDMI